LSLVLFKIASVKFKM